MRSVDDELGVALELGIAWREALEAVPPRWALTLSRTRDHATAAVYQPGDGGSSLLVYTTGGDTEADALRRIREQLR